jgi:hypothetical protein
MGFLQTGGLSLTSLRITVTRRDEVAVTPALSMRLTIKESDPVVWMLKGQRQLNASQQLI